MAVDSISGEMSQSDMLVETYKQTQAYRVDSLKTKKTDLQSRQAFYNGLNARLNSLITQLDKFGSYKQVEGSFSLVKEDDVDDNFKTRSSSLSEKDYFTVTSKGDAIVGTNTMKVQRLASNDVLVSNRLNLSDAFGETAGEKSFDIMVNDKTFNVKVNFTGSETSQEAMTKIVNAINSIDEITVSASLVKDTETTGRISLISKETGENNKISFTSNSTTDLIGWNTSMFADPNARTTFSGASAGYKTADSSVLNSKFEVNGIEISRNKNEVDDVLPGTTIKLLKVQSADAEPITVTTEVDVAGVESFVDALVKEFNGLLTFLNSNKSIQKTDPGMGSLQTRLRSIMSSQMSFSENEDAPKYITDIGFRINTDGTLVLRDKEKLKEFLLKENGSQNVADLFTSSTGFVAKINEVIVNLKPQNSSESGLIRARNQSINTQIINLDKRIASVESSIEQQAEGMRKEYEAYLKVYLQAQGQYSLLSTMPTDTSGYNSLLASQYSQ